VKNLEGLPADHPMRELMTPLYHLSDHTHDNEHSSLLYPTHHHHHQHDPSLNISDNFHSMNPNSNYMHNMNKNQIHSMFNIQDMMSGAHIYDKNPVLSIPNHVEAPHSKEEQENDDGEEDGSHSDTDSANKKRGKYRTYTEEEKAQILQLASKHGIEKTLDLFSEGEHKLTKRKLRSWLESQDKIKGVKGRKSNEPNRDGFLYEWYISFQNEHNRPPTRKEATKRALEITDDPKFQASKGWLDKFSRKFKVEFTPLKIVPPKTFKKGPFEDDISTATTMASALITGEDTPPKGVKKVKLDKLQVRKIQSAPSQEKEQSEKTELRAPLGGKNQLSQNPHDDSQPGFHAPSHFKQPAQLHSNSISNDSGSLFSSNTHKAPSENVANDSNKPPGYQMPFYPIDYSMYNPFNYQGVYPNMPNYPMNYPMNMPMNYPTNFAESYQRLQQAMKKDNDPKADKTN